MSIQMENCMAIVLCPVQDGTRIPAPSRREIFASFSVIFYCPPLSSPIYFSLCWKGFFNTGDGLDSEEQPGFHDTIFRVELSGGEGDHCRTMLGVSAFSTHPSRHKNKNSNNSLPRLSLPF